MWRVVIMAIEPIAYLSSTNANASIFLWIWNLMCDCCEILLKLIHTVDEKSNLTWKYVEIFRGISVLLTFQILYQIIRSPSNHSKHFLGNSYYSLIIGLLYSLLNRSSRKRLHDKFII